ncbi:hypothetical protein NNC19_04860 [Clostridium sp. SHJSY1]|uniref:hypothetical protein n=1 Tax=Clostridium sp. SHJSY1 TaxID=2942483 RepID=UPI002873F71F|nr:hypothetical protein [Clostridium sp. SHJSY1]MDS0525002.1 hypothetical protein [Clostridium sp. SHJSY1]
MEYSGFFNGSYKYGQEEFSRYYENIYSNGVSFDDDSHMTLKVTNDGSQLKVASGFAIIKGYYFYNKETKVLNISKPMTGKRIDRIVIKLNSTVGSSSMSIELKAGSDAKAPDLIRSNNVYELSLASVTIDSIGNITVVDERMDDSLCGGIRPRNVSAYNDMIAKMDDDFKNWMNKTQNKAREIYIQGNKPEESVSGSIWIQISAT